MLSIKSQKEKTFGQIGALRTLTNDFPQLNINNSFPSIDNKGNPQDFLIDVIKALIGYEAIRETFINVLTYAITEIEPKLKELLKSEIKSINSCGINPVIPTWFQSTGTGIVIEVKKLDFFNIFKIDPSTMVGGLIYGDVSNGFASTDMNTFLYNVIQNPGTAYSWPNASNPIITVQFDDVASPSNNILTIKAAPPYDSRPLSELNNDFIESINILSTADMLVKILDNIFGALTSLPQINKTEKQLESESAINELITELMDSEETDVIFNDDFFLFTEERSASVKEEAKNRRKGITKLKTCGDIEVSIPISIIQTTFTSLLAPLNTTEDVKNVLEVSLNNMAGAITLNNVGSEDEYSVTLGFFEALFKGLATAFMNAILSPRVILIFVINYKLMNGQNAVFTDPIDFMKKNRKLIKGIVDSIRDTIVEMLLSIAIKHILKLVAANSIEMLKERGNNQIAILLSLVGVSQDVIAMIRNNIPVTL